MSKKVTTEEFVEKAKLVHSDKYDYSKVEYVNCEVKICIICPEHGEFWQTPHCHLSGHGCSICAGNQKKWNYETCYEEARKYSGRWEFNKKSVGAYECAKRNGWLDDYTWFKTYSKPSGYWTYETCYEEAKKYTDKKTFGRNAVQAYYLARKNGWIDDYTWFVKHRENWTLEKCKEVAKKYTRATDFCNNDSACYASAKRHGWLKFLTYNIQ